MASKNFVSIHFTRTTLQIVKLNKDSTKLEKYSTIKIPDGLIVNYRVTDEKQLTELIKTAFKSLKIYEKNVGIIVPEFSTFAKLIQLPVGLTSEELNEAVNWQVSEFVPSAENDSVMDWKIVDSTSDKNNILFVSINKDILSGYVNVISAANLYPVVVETQALALLRIAKQEKTTRLILYRNFGEVVFVLSSGGYILGSSVVPDNQEERIVQTAGEMIKHYSNEQVESIIIAGKGFPQEFYSKVKNYTGVAVAGISPPITGAQSTVVHEYLIPISQQLQDPLQPKDERTVNLLPPDWIKKYTYARYSRRIWSVLVVVTAVMWILLAIVLFNYSYLNANLALTKGSSNADNAQEVQVLQEIDRINNRVAVVNKVIDANVYPQEIINKITSAAPVGVQIAKYELDLDKGVFVVRGTASTREGLINFKEGLESVEDFSQVSIPISSLAQEFNIEFVINLRYSKINQNQPKKLNI